MMLNGSQAQAPVGVAIDARQIESLAREAKVEAVLVKALYESELAQLEADAKIRGFLNVLATRGVRDRLREQRARRERA